MIHLQNPSTICHCEVLFQIATLIHVLFQNATLFAKHAYQM
jgi:hypothetical protein